MTTEEFWGKYMNEDILEIFDDTCDFFKKKLPDDFVENYDFDEVILETQGHHVIAKSFDKVLIFSELIRDKQPELYQENFQYLDDFLIDYYCFHGDKKEVEKAFSNFMNRPVQGFDQYLISFKKLLFYQFTDLIEKAIDKNFHEVANADDLIGGAEYDLALGKLYLTLEDLYKRDREKFDKVEFSERLDEFNFDFSECFLSAIEQGVFKPDLNLEQLNDAFIQDRTNCLTILHGYFLKYMYDKKISFPVSGNIWRAMLRFWEIDRSQKKVRSDVYFKVRPDKLEKYLVDLAGGMFVNNRSEMIAALWGSIYIYDFLSSIEVISESVYSSFLHTSRILKGKVIGQFTADLWNANFVHDWERPDSIAETEFVEEEKIFRKSIAFKTEEFANFEEDISEELSKIGQLSGFIIEGARVDNNGGNLSIIDELAKGLDGGDKEEETETDRHSNGKDNSRKENITVQREPIHIEQKTGRNEPCPCGSGKKYKKCCG